MYVDHFVITSRNTVARLLSLLLDDSVNCLIKSTTCGAVMAGEGREEKYTTIRTATDNHTFL